MGPGREVDIGRSALGVRGVARPGGEEDVRFLELGIAACGLGKPEALVPSTIVAACAVPACAALPGMVASRVKDLVA